MRTFIAKNLPLLSVVIPSGVKVGNRPVAGFRIDRVSRENTLDSRDRSFNRGCCRGWYHASSFMRPVAGLLSMASVLLVGRGALA